MEINAPRYVRLFRNLPIEGKGRGEATAVVSLAMARKSAILTIKVMALYAMVNMWNHIMFPDEEDELGDYGRRQLHLILGRRSDGSTISLRFQGALSDALNWFGAQDFPQDMEDLAKGKKTVYQYLAEAPYEVANKLIQATRPDVKMAAELLSGKQFFPEFTKPRAIRDRTEHVANLFSLAPIYKRIANKPIRGNTVMGRLWSDISSLATYTADPGEVAYHETRKLGNEWLEKKGIEKGWGDPTSKGNAMYYYRQALKYGDDRSAAKYLRRYKELGGNLKGMRQSIKMAHPLSTVPRKYQSQFMASLGKEERERLKRAIEWYRKTYMGMKLKR